MIARSHFRDQKFDFEVEDVWYLFGNFACVYLDPSAVARKQNFSIICHQNFHFEYLKLLKNTLRQKKDYSNHPRLKWRCLVLVFDH